MDFYESGIIGKILDAEDNPKPVDSNSCPQPMGKFPPQTPVAMAYVPFQSWEKPYDMDAGLSRGTVFPSLDKPFIGKEAVRHVHD